MTVNLDKLKAKEKKVLFLGKQYDLSYIPAGISLLVIEQFNQLVKMSENEKEQERIIDKSIELVGEFTSFYFPEIDVAYLRKNADVSLINRFIQELIEAISQEAKLSPIKDPLTHTKKKRLVGILS